MPHSFRAHADEIDGILVCLPNFGQESAVADAIRLSRLNVPVLVQACADDPALLQLENRRDAFCGKLSLCNNLVQQGIRFSLTKNHVCAVDGEDFCEDVDRFARVCTVVRAMRTARMSLALEDWMDEHHCDAGAIQCGDTPEANYGCAMCLSMSWMGEKGRPSACETDVLGALSMLALLKAAGTPPIYQDWNNNYADVPDECINVHCSNYPACAFAQKPKIGNLDILATTLGTDVSFGALKGRVRPGAMTHLKIDTDDAHGRIRCYLGQGRFTDDALDTFGGVAVCEVPRLNDLMRYLSRSGFEHHVALVHGACADALEDALGNCLGWDVYRHS